MANFPSSVSFFICSLNISPVEIWGKFVFLAKILAVVPDQVIVERILNRATCSNKECGAIYNTKFKPSKVEGICDICGSALVTRTDDTEEAIKTRLEVYRQNSKDLIDYYKEKGVLVNITPNDPTADNASEQAVDIILEKVNQ